MVKKSQKDPQKKKKKSKTLYFTQATEDSIVAWQKEKDPALREKIFVDEIQQALAKLIENLIFVYKFHTNDDIDLLKSDCMSALYESLGKFNAERGHKAFSYYNVIARNWFIQRSKVRQKRAVADVRFDDIILGELERNNHLSVVSAHEEDMINSEFLRFLKVEMKTWRDKFDKPHERKVLEAVIVLFENPDLIPLHNKKGIYMYLREMTSMNTKQIVTNLNKFKKKYFAMKKRYLNGEI